MREANDLTKNGASKGKKYLRPPQPDAYYKRTKKSKKVLSESKTV